MFRKWISISLLVMAFLGPLTPDASGQDSIAKQLADLEALKAKFLKDKETAKQKVLDKFNALIQQVTVSGRGKAADRLSLADSLREERQVFAEKEDVPDNTAVLGAAWEYGIALVIKYKPVSTKFNDLIAACLNAGRIDQAKKTKADKEQFDNDHLPGRKQFAGGAAWTGSQFEGGNGILSRFQVTELRGTLFKGRLERNIQVGGHPIFDVAGRLDGIFLEFTRLVPVQGSIGLTECKGIVLGQTMILRLITVSRKGIPTVGLAVLRKK
jgi:hypothetical protein